MNRRVSPPRRARRRRSSACFEPADVDVRMAELLCEVSDQWLAAKQVIERQFSIGYFDALYVRRFRCGVVEEQNGSRRILAFANLLEGPRRQELSVDPDALPQPTAPRVMDFLITSVLLWGKRGWLSHVQPRHGAARLGGRAPRRAHAASGSRRSSSAPRRAVSTLPGRPLLQAEVQPGLAAALHGVRGRVGMAGCPRQRQRAHRGQLEGPFTKA